MFDQVWRWAGRYRHHDVNIGGIGWRDVPVVIRYLVDDTKEWLDTELYGPVEIAVRFHHRLVQIHAFVNGNGRHGRFAADYLIEALGEPRFTWGAGLDRGRGELRARYRRALRSMDHDHDDVTDLLGFARS